MMPDTEIESRALDIAAFIMAASGMCKYEMPGRCKRQSANNDICGACIKSWLIFKAKQGLRMEAKK